MLPRFNAQFIKNAKISASINEKCVCVCVFQGRKRNVIQINKAAFSRHNASNLPQERLTKIAVIK